MNPRRLFLAACTFVALALGARADEWPKLVNRGGEVYRIDAALREAFAKNDAKDLPETKRKLPAAAAPAFDWTKLVSRPFIYAQKDNPQCWAFAAVTAFEWNWAIRNGGTAPVLAVQPVIDRTKKEGEAPFHLAFEVLLEQGTAPLNTYPYIGKAGKIRANAPLSYRAIAWGEVAPGRGVPPEAKIKQALLEHGPIAASVYATPLFEAYRGGIFREHVKLPENGPRSNHTIVIVGWDDKKGKGCWKVQNSWGPKWGEGGFMWIEYGCNNIGINACWVRPQAMNYLLPATANKQVPGDVTPFHVWAKAKSIPLPPEPELPTITPAEALKKPGERVSVQFEVKGFGTVNPEGHVQLFSERSPDVEGCLTVWILHSGLDKFPVKEPRALFDYYRRKQLRVRGSIEPITISNGVLKIVEVTDPGQIEEIK